MTSPVSDFGSVSLDLFKIYSTVIPHLFLVYLSSVLKFILFGHFCLVFVCLFLTL